MIYLYIFLGLILACISLGIANIVLRRVKRKRAKASKEEGGK